MSAAEIFVEAPVYGPSPWKLVAESEALWSEGDQSMAEFGDAGPLEPRASICD